MPFSLSILSSSIIFKVPPITSFVSLSFSYSNMAALKAVHVSDVPILDHVVPDQPLLVLSASRSFNKGGTDNMAVAKPAAPKFMVVGHRGCGMNMLQSSDRRFKALKENSVLSFNAAAKFGVEFVEFDVQDRPVTDNCEMLGFFNGWFGFGRMKIEFLVTKDDCPVIFHDNFVLSQEGSGSIIEKRVTELTLEELFQYGLQREPGNAGKAMLRKTKDGRIYSWNVESDDSLCTLQEAFEKVDPLLGFNVELKFDDNIIYEDNHLSHVLQAILKVVLNNAKDRKIIFSSFQPDAVRIVRKLQSIYPVYFLTNGGSEIYNDERRNSLDEAIKHCLENGLQGVVSEVKAIFRNPGAIHIIKEANLCLLTYGQLNNVPEAVYMQHLMGVDGVIVDWVKEISEAVLGCTKPVEAVNSSLSNFEGESVPRPNFSQRDLAFLLKLIPELIQKSG